MLLIADKLKITEKNESGIMKATLVADHGISVTTVQDIKKNKESIRKSARKLEVNTKAGKRQNKRKKAYRKTLKMPTSVTLVEEVHK